MIFKEFDSLLSIICSHSTIAPGRSLVWAFIANPQAGGFTIKSRWKKHYAMLRDCSGKAEKNPLREGRPAAIVNGNGYMGLIKTISDGHAAVLTNSIIKEAEAERDDNPFYLIITAGGDGTSLEVMTSLFYAPDEVRKNFAILRLPLGTANDGADSEYLSTALDLLIEPSVISMQRAVRLKTASGKGPFLAFNILSVGADAFVTHMTNKMKGRMPGDSYKLWVNIAAIFYDLIYKVDYIDVHSKDANGTEVKSFIEKLLLLAVGESGKRCYGSHKWILPDERNVCALKQMPLLRKAHITSLLPKGTHVTKSEAILWSAHSVEFSARQRILAQMDGETVLLEKQDFPAVIELTEPVIQILKKLQEDGE